MFLFNFVEQWAPKRPRADKRGFYVYNLGDLNWFQYYLREFLTAGLKFTVLKIGFVLWLTNLLRIEKNDFIYLINTSSVLETIIFFFTF